MQKKIINNLVIGLCFLSFLNLPFVQSALRANITSHLTKFSNLWKETHVCPLAGIGLLRSYKARHAVWGICLMFRHFHLYLDLHLFIYEPRLGALNDALQYIQMHIYNDFCKK